MEEKAVLLDVQDGIATITLNRPKNLNGINLALIAELIGALDTAKTDESVRSVIITGSGRAFCAGGDVVGHPSLSSPDAVQRYKYVSEAQEVILKVRRLSKPVIGAINGHASGAGLDLALACDLRILAEDAVLTEVYARVGLMSDWGGSYFLPRLVGLGKAMELLLTSDDIDAQEALRIGLVNRVVPKEKLMEEATALAMRFAKGPALAYHFIKSAVYGSLSKNLEEALQTEAFGQASLIGTEDVQGAIKAFMEKRKPEFKGK